MSDILKHELDLAKLRSRNKVLMNENRELKRERNAAVAAKQTRIERYETDVIKARSERDAFKTRLDLKMPPGTVKRRFAGVCAKAVELGLCSGLEAKCASSFLLEHVDQLRRERDRHVKTIEVLTEEIRITRQEREDAVAALKKNPDEWKRYVKTHPAVARLEQWKKIAEGRDLLLLSYRIGQPHAADRGLTMIESAEKELKRLDGGEGE